MSDVYGPFTFTRKLSKELGDCPLFSDEAAFVVAIFFPFVMIAFVGALYLLITTVAADTLLLPFGLFNWGYQKAAERIGR